MQTTVARSSLKRVSAATVTRVGSVRPVRPVVCQAQQTPKQLIQAAVGLPALVAASPAFALVDDRLNGDGVGLAFGVNEGILGWVLVGMLAFVWSLWYSASKDLGDFDDEDSGLKIED